ncbi:ATP-binding cassette domain-containing protein, partial [Escherichia coli]|nr:ATP-binding cassette domain-containing protein [Escherichia coli]
RKIDRPERIERLERLLEGFGISHVRNVRGDALSGGERRRVEIARCLACNPHFILLDEPFAGIDPIAIEELREMILYLKKQGI